MDVGEDGGDGAALVAGELGAPCCGVEVLEDELVHSLVYGVAFHEHFAEVGVGISLWLKHGITWKAFCLVWIV